MSLINQMLQDLDARQETSAGANWSGVRPLPAAPLSRLPYALAAIAALGVIALGACLAQWEPDTVVSARMPHAQAVLQVIETPVPVFVLEEEDSTEEIEEAQSANDNGLKIVAAMAAEEAAEVVVEKKPRIRRDPLPNPASPANPATAPEKTPERGVIRKTDPMPQDQVETDYRRAADAADQGRTAEALAAARSVLNANSRHTAARQLLIKLLLAERYVDVAIQTLQEGLQGQPEQSAWAMTLARLYLNQGELEKAAQTMQKSLPAGAANPGYLGFAGHLQQRLGYGREAASLYQAAIILAPNDGRWWLGLGLAQESEGIKEAALTAFRRARQCDNLSRELNLLVEQKLRRLE